MEPAGELSKASRRRKAAAAVVPVLALLAVTAGLVTALWTQSQANFGWFAYAPLSNETFSGGGLVHLGVGTKVGVALVATGLLVLAFWSGYRTATHRTDRHSTARHSTARHSTARHRGGPHRNS